MYRLICKYCDYHWYRRHVNYYEKKCPKCDDSNFTTDEMEKTDIDYYQGSPPFPEEKEDTKDIVLDYGETYD